MKFIETIKKVINRGKYHGYGLITTPCSYVKTDKTAKFTEHRRPEHRNGWDIVEIEYDEVECVQCGDKRYFNPKEPKVVGWMNK